MWWDSENSSNLINLKFSCFEELCFIWRNGNRCILHSFFQNSNLVRISSAKSFVPAVSHSVRIFDRSRILKDSSGSGSVCKKLGSIFFCRNGKPNCILGHRYRRISNQSVKTKTRNMQDIFLLQIDRSFFHGRSIGIRYLVLIVNLPTVITIHCHTIWHEWI